NDNTGTETVFARFEHLKLEPGIYYIDVFDEFMEPNDIGLVYYMHLYVEADMEVDVSDPFTWEADELGYHYETVTTTDENGTETTSEILVYDHALVELTPATPALNDELKVNINGKCYDSEGREVTAFYYLWYRNGQIVHFNGSTAITDEYSVLMQQIDNHLNIKQAALGQDRVTSDLTFEGDVWECVVIPYSDVDGFGYDAMKNTNAVRIGSTNSWSMKLSRGYFLDDDWSAIDTVEIGWKENATNGFDPVFDEASPSLTVPNGDGTYRRQVLPDGAMYTLGLSNAAPYLQKDYRPYGKSASWFVVVEMGSNGADSSTIAWNATGIPDAASGITITQMYKRVDGYYDVVPGTTTKVTSGTAGYITLDPVTFGELQLDANCQKYAVYRISIGGEDITPQEISLTTGWNLVSFALTPIANDVDDVFSKDGSKLYSGVVWKFSGGRYVEADTVEAGKAYWLYSKAATTITVFGASATDSISLEAGWNLIGPVFPVDDFEAAYKKSYPDVYTKIATNEEGGLEIYKFVYDSETGKSSYGLATDGKAYKLELGQGYWIKTTQAVDLPFVK
ncbi:MAG: hypothetical protein IKR13_04305, partial [Victivallales bacterium]|nr:hypothetical protein [Victivallales bacterium]